MKSVFTILIPALAIVLLFRFTGVWGGLAGFAVYFIGMIFIKLPDYLMILAGMQYEKNREKSLAYMEKALKTKRLRVEYILYYGFVCLKAGEVERAERVLAEAEGKKMSPETACRAAVNRALLVWKKGDIAKAIEILEEQLKIGENKAVYGTLGQLLLQNGQLQRAREVNERAFVFDKYDEAITDNLALTYRMTGDIDSSVNLYKELTGKRLGIPLPYYNYGETLYGIGRKAEAIEMMEKALAYPFSALAVVSRDEICARIAQIEAEIKESEEK